MKITLIGATGMLGVPVIKQFIKSGFEVTIIARNKEKAQAFISECSCN